MGLPLLLILSVFILLICFALGYSYILRNSMWVEISWKRKDMWYMNPFGLFRTRDAFRNSYYFFGAVCFFLVAVLILIIYFIIVFWRYA